MIVTKRTTILFRSAPDEPASEELSSAWRWFVAFGLCLGLLGAIASLNVVFATVATAYYVGVMMLAGGIVLIAHAIGVRQWGWLFFWLASGVLYVAAGAAVLYDPRFALTMITLFLAADFVLIGFLRLWIVLGARESAGWAWLAAAAAITIGVAVVLALRASIASIWILALALAIDLLMQGAAFAALGVALRRHSPVPVRTGSARPAVRRRSF
jgi:uncharacterized membrane protein HdeD (DUF308 family)